MARVPIHGVFTDGTGNIVVGGTATVYEFKSAAPSSPDTTATIYTAYSGGSVITGGAITTDSNGAYLAWVDDGDYSTGDVFTLILSKDTYNDNPWHFCAQGL